MGKFSIDKKLLPRFGVVSTEDSKVSFKFLVYSFRLSVSLRVVSGAHGEFDSEKSSPFLKNLCGELWSSIRDDSVGESESSVDVLMEKVRSSGCVNGFIARSEDYSLCKSLVYHDQDGIISVRVGKIRDEVHGKLCEGSCRFWGFDRG